MKSKYLLCFFLVIVFNFNTSIAQNIGIGTAIPDSSAALDITKTCKGMLVPRMTFANRPANPAKGLLYCQTDADSGFYYYDGSAWKGIVNKSPMLPGGTQVNGENGLKVNTTNSGSGQSDWIAVNAGGSAGDRVVFGNLNGNASIGSRNSNLTAWSDMTINQDGGTVIVEGQSLTAPTGGLSSGLARPLVVNESVRQSY